SAACPLPRPKRIYAATAASANVLSRGAISIGRSNANCCRRRIPSMPSFLDRTIPASVHVAELIIVASAYIRAAIVSASGSAARKANRAEVSTTIIVVQIGPELVLRPLGIIRFRRLSGQFHQFLERRALPRCHSSHRLVSQDVPRFLLHGNAVLGRAFS